MTKNPIINAAVAMAYIAIVSILMFFGTRNLPKQDTFLDPIAVLSLFTLSAAVMGYIFAYEPFQLYFDGKKKEALGLFLKTVASFGVITAILLALLFSGIIK